MENPNTLHWILVAIVIGTLLVQIYILGLPDMLLNAIQNLIEAKRKKRLFTNTQLRNILS